MHRLGALFWVASAVARQEAGIPSSWGGEGMPGVWVWLFAAEGELVDLFGGVAGPFVDADDGFLVGALRETEDLPGDRVGPPALEVHALSAFDGEVLAVRLV